MLKTFLITILIIIAIIVIFPLDIIASTIGVVMIIDATTPKSNYIASFNNVKIEEYERYEELGEEGYGSCEAIYFNEEQAKNIEMQIKNDENWTTRPLKEEFIEDYKKFNITELGKCYYYLVQYSRDGYIIETNRDILDNRGLRWYESAVYDSDNKILYSYYEHYSR